MEPAYKKPRCAASRLTSGAPQTPRPWILEAARERAQGRVLAAAWAKYLAHLAAQGAQAVGLDIELERTRPGPA